MSLNALHHAMSVYNQKRSFAHTQSLHQRIQSVFRNGNVYGLEKRSHHTPIDSWLETLTLKIYLTLESLLEHRWVRAMFIGTCCYALIDPLSAAVTDTLKDAVVNLQAEIFGSGWITVGKIAAAAVGGVMAIARSSAVPFAMGAGVAGGLHFFQKHTEAAAGCLF